MASANWQKPSFCVYMPDISKQKSQIKELLKIHYGFGSFRPGQERVIDNILAGKSTVVIMPTGGGKSLCFQLPALVLEGVTIVVSPLIALMKDQVDSLVKIGIPATFINSSISLAETSERLESVKQGKYKLLYIAPERFYNLEFMRALSNIKVSLFAIDEAHCISQWGHDFRPSYMKLKDAINNLDNPVVIALTATATSEVRDDIIKQLNLKNPELVITGFSRPNLQFGVIKANDAQKSQLIIDAVQSANNGNGIIYAGTRSRVENITQILLENNVEAASYHAGMDAEDRKWVQENFMSGKAKVIVATNAFGLGIDKPDIRFVVHYDMPGTIEAYYQEAGRAGRDGKKSFCLMFCGTRDRYLQEFFIKGDNPPPEVILELYNILIQYPSTSEGKESNSILITYAELAKMLSDSAPEMAIGTALKILEREGYISRSREKSGKAYLKLTSDFTTALNSLGKRAKTQRQILDKLYQRFEKDLKSGWQVNFEEIADILDVKKETLARMVKTLAENNMVEYNPPFRGTEINILKRVSEDELDIDFTALKNKLKKSYQKLDMLENYIYHLGCRQKYILDYFGDSEAKDCGVCDNCLVGGGYQRKTAVPRMDNSARHSHESQKNYSRKSTKKEYLSFNKSKDDEMEVEAPDLNIDFSTKLTQLETFDLHNQGMSLSEMAQTRNVKPGTIIQHLCYLIEKNLDININKFVSQAKQKKISQAIKKVGDEKLTLIKEELGDDINWDEIRLMLAVMKK